MAHFAQIDENNIVVRVLVVEQEVIDTGCLGDPSTWIQTSYNTRSGVHQAGGTALRKNFAGAGFIYDAERDAFYEPKPPGTWILNEDTCDWQRPIPMPQDENWYYWDETAQNWVQTDDAIKHGQ